MCACVCDPPLSPIPPLLSHTRTHTLSLSFSPLPLRQVSVCLRHACCSLNACPAITTKRGHGVPSLLPGLPLLCLVVKRGGAGDFQACKTSQPHKRHKAKTVHRTVGGWRGGVEIRSFHASTNTNTKTNAHIVPVHTCSISATPSPSSNRAKCIPGLFQVCEHLRARTHARTHTHTHAHTRTHTHTHTRTHTHTHTQTNTNKQTHMQTRHKL